MWKFPYRGCPRSCHPRWMRSLARKITSQLLPSINSRDDTQFLMSGLFERHSTCKCTERFPFHWRNLALCSIFKLKCLKRSGYSLSIGSRGPSCRNPLAWEFRTQRVFAPSASLFFFLWGLSLATIIRVMITLHILLYLFFSSRKMRVLSWLFKIGIPIRPIMFKITLPCYSCHRLSLDAQKREKNSCWK